jgi:hypothetical protein
VENRAAALLSLGAAITKFVARVRTESMPSDVADELADATARMAGQLGWAIAPHRERTGFALAGAPVAVKLAPGAGAPAAAVPAFWREAALQSSLNP